MSALRNRADSSTDFSNPLPVIRDAINDSIAKIVHIQDDMDPPAPECFERTERLTLEVCMELGRRALQGVLEDRDARRPDEIVRDGRVFRRRKATPKTITTLLGSAAYRLSRYRTRAAGASRVPLDAGLGLIKGHPARPTARVCVLLMSHCPARDAHEILAKVGAASPSAGTLQRVTRLMHADLCRCRSKIPQFLLFWRRASSVV